MQKINSWLMEQRAREYPIGVQDFKTIREAGGVYIDKTGYVYNMTHTLSHYYFLSRPRRFGKTLLTSTLEYYFEGRHELRASSANSLMTLAYFIWSKVLFANIVYFVNLIASLKTK